MAAFTLTDRGYFTKDGEHFVPFGANYWTSSCGVEMWQHWPAEEIKQDLDLMKKLGMNTIRFFLRWPDFELQPERYEQRMIERLQELLSWCEERDLVTIPTLFVGFMSGGFFWPRWKGEMNLFSNEHMRLHSVNYAHAMCEAMKDYEGSILAVDHGNELTAVPDVVDAGPTACRHWSASVSDAIKRVLKNTMVMSGHDHNQVVLDRSWRFDGQPGCDFLSMHSYPVPAWQPIEFDGMTDELCQSLLPYYTQCARAFGPVMIQEFGTIVTFGKAQQEAYLNAILPACWEAGANGFLWWCLKDIPARIHPYLKGRKESTLGVVDIEHNVKPGMDVLIDFGRSLQERPLPESADDAIGIYWAKHYYPLEDDGNPGNDCPKLARQMLVANHALRELGYTTRVIRGGFGIPQDCKTLVIAGVNIDSLEVEALMNWVRDGGKLLWHGPSPMGYGPECIELTGAKPVDYRSMLPAAFECFGQSWSADIFSGNGRLQVELTTAELIAADGRDLPVVYQHAYGEGQVVTVMPQMDDVFAQSAADLNQRINWQTWYRGMLALMG